MAPTTLGIETQPPAEAALPFAEVDDIELDSLPRPPPTPPPFNIAHAGNEANVSSSWHPKLTAYRFTFVAVTIALGTAKAARQSSSAASVTIEWVSGIVVLLL